MPAPPPPPPPPRSFAVYRRRRHPFLVVGGRKATYLFLFRSPFTDDADDGHEALNVDGPAEVVLAKFAVGLHYLASFVGSSLLHTAFHL